MTEIDSFGLRNESQLVTKCSLRPRIRLKTTAKYITSPPCNIQLYVNLRTWSSSIGPFIKLAKICIFSIVSVALNGKHVAG